MLVIRVLSKNIIKYIVLFAAQVRYHVVGLFVDPPAVLQVRVRLLFVSHFARLDADSHDDVFHYGGNNELIFYIIIIYKPSLCQNRSSGT